MWRDHRDGEHFLRFFDDPDTGIAEVRTVEPEFVIEKAWPQQGGAEFWTDGIEGSTILETKLIKNAQRSPFIAGSDIPDVLRAKIIRRVEGEFVRMGTIINDPTNPLKSVQVIVSDQRAVPFFEGLLKKHGIPGKVVVKPE